MFEIIIISVISLFVLYWVISGAVKDAIDSRLRPYLVIYAKMTKKQAEGFGMSEEEIDSILLTKKEFKKKYKK